MTDVQLRALQQKLALQFGHTVDVYCQEGKGVLAVKHGEPLHLTNVIYAQFI